MSWFDRLRNQTRDDKLARDIDREMQFHLAERADALVAGGMDPVRARDEARRRFGNLGLQKERTRERDLFMMLDTLLTDLRYAIRALRATPAFALVAILSLGLGIGANTAIFSILNAVMLKTLPVDHPEQLVAVDRSGSEELTNPLWEAIRDRQDMFSGVFASSNTRYSLATGGEARWMIGNRVSGDFFSTLGVRPVLGRVLTRNDDVRGCPPVAVLSYGFWQSEYGGDASVLGKALKLNGHPFAIVGVADPRFNGIDVGINSQAYVPICTETITDGPDVLEARSNWYLRVVGRPKPGMTTEQINARFTAITPNIVAATLPPNWPADAVEGYRKAAFTVKPAATGFSALRTQYKTALYDLMAIVGLVLIVACANVANLLLARATVRRREIAVRLALGASRGRIARQLITESLLLSTLGALTGLAIAMWSSRLLVSLLSQSGQAIALDLALDLRVLGFTVVVAMLTGLIFGIAPAWQSSHVKPQAALKAHGRGTAGFARMRVARVLVVSQIAISLVLIAAAGLLIGSWRRLATLDPGFRRDRILLVRADLRDAIPDAAQGDAIPDAAQGDAMKALLARIRGIPGVRSAATVVVTPVSGIGWNGGITVAGFTPASKRDAVSWMNAVSDGYFSTLGIPLLSGHDFDAGAAASAASDAIVSESMARKFFGTPNVVGRTFRSRDGRVDVVHRIIGVVGSTKYRSLRDSMPPIVYFPSASSVMDATINFAILSDEPTGIIDAAKRAIAETSPRITVDFTTMERQLGDSMRLMGATTTLAGFFGGLALVLATIGLYGIMSYNVARRRNEIGVRIALGADRGRVVRMVLGDVGRIVAVGIVLGLVLSSAATRLVSTFMYEVKRNDPATLIASAALLAIVGMLAAALPAWRAARSDPVAALRED